MNAARKPQNMCEKDRAKAKLQMVNKSRKTKYPIPSGISAWTLCISPLHAEPLKWIEWTVVVDKVFQSMELVSQKATWRQSASPAHPLGNTWWFQNDYTTIRGSSGIKLREEKKLGRRKGHIKTLGEVRILRFGRHFGCRWHCRCPQQYRLTSPIRAWPESLEFRQSPSRCLAPRKVHG